MFAREQKGNASTASTEVNVPGTNKAEADINFPSHLSLPHSLSCFVAFLMSLCFALSERKSSDITSLSSEPSKRS